MQTAMTIHSADLFPSVDIFGMTVHGPTTPQAVALIEQWIRERDGSCRRVIVTGFHGLWVGHEDPEFRQMLASADLFVPDGIAPVWLSRLHGDPLPQRVPGAELMAGLLDQAQKQLYRSFFYGDTEPTLATLRAKLEQRYPRMPIGEYLSPPFRALSSEEEEAHIEAINASGADILWVGLGCPKQERWIARNAHRLNVPVAIGVGAAFRFHAGLVQRVPGWLGEAGLEWLWRLAAEPRKMWRRDALDGPRFVIAALADAWKARRVENR